ncbi:MAG: non-homologous end-joining DNA ligase [Acidobacteria bacterium]|nr:non-homologous end-joining DNA ligase [Acidobacteriota bacterium]
MAKKDTAEVLSLDGREVRVTNPDKLYFSKQTKVTKLELVRYYLSVAPGAIAGIRDRPIVLKRYVNGADGDAFYQKRAPDNRPEWLRTVTLSFPSGRVAEEIVVDDAAGLAWVVNLGCIELHPHAIRANDLDHPDELRVDLDPNPGVSWEDVRVVALEVNALLGELGLRGWPKTSGSRGMHVNVRIQQHWTFSEVRRAAVALSREIERRVPKLATSKWWKEERHGVFLDYNQNAKDRTTCSAYSVRPLPDARVSMPLRWEEVEACDPADFTIVSVPQRFAELGDAHAEMDQHAGSLEKLLELAARDEKEGLGDAPWPPHFKKMSGEAPRVAPSRARSAAKKSAAGEKSGSAEGSAAADTKTPSAEGSDAADTKTRSAETSDAADAKTPSAEKTPRAEKSTRSAAAKTRSAAAKKPARVQMPLLVIANSPNKDAALAGLERWKRRHRKVAKFLAVDDVLVDSMRGRSSTWTRIRVNLRNVPEALRPAQETPDPDDDPTREWRASKGVRS